MVVDEMVTTFVTIRNSKANLILVHIDLNLDNYFQLMDPRPSKGDTGTSDHR